MFLWLAFNLNWLDIMYLSIVVLILTTTGYIYYHMLESMEQNLILIREDRRQLLQKNLDLVNENKELKKMFNKIIKLSEMNIEDKKFVSSF
jgi:cellulose biosynthesis protein BcsQ